MGQVYFLKLLKYKPNKDKLSIYCNFIFEYVPKIPSEMNSKHPFYSILIPMTSHAKIFILVVGGPKGVPEP